MIFFDVYSPLVVKGIAMTGSEKTQHFAPVLIVEDDTEISSTLARIVQPLFDVCVASTISGARQMITKHTEWSAALIDVHLPDGSGLEVMRELLGRSPQTSVLILTASRAKTVINTVQLFGVEYAVKPITLANIQAFLERVTDRLQRDRTALEAAVADVGNMFKLSQSERALLFASASGVARKDLSDHLTLTDNTVKTQIRVLL